MTATRTNESRPSVVVPAGSDYCCLTAEAAEQTREAIPHESDVRSMAELFSVLGDPTRIRILSVLAAGPMCVKDLALVVGMQQTAVSHQLKVLRYTRLVRTQRIGKLSVYSLDDDHVTALFRVGLEHVQGT